MKFSIATLALALSSVAVAAPTAGSEQASGVEAAGTKRWCLGHSDGQDGPAFGCPWKRDNVEEVKRWCLRPGQGCWKVRREVEDEVKRWCLRPGQGCWKAKRAAEELFQDIPDENLAAPEGGVEHTEEKRWCLRPGQGCW